MRNPRRTAAASHEVRVNNMYYHPIILWLIHHFRAFVYGFGELVRSPLASTMTIAVIGVTLALPTGFYLLLQNFQTISQTWDATPTISLYLKKNISNDQISQLIKQLRNQRNIKKVRYISPQEGLSEFKKITSLNELSTIVQTNPLPPVIVVTPTHYFQSPSHLKTLLEYLKKITTVEITQLDMAWVKRLYHLIAIGDRIFYMLVILFSMGIIFIIGNTIRLTTQNHRQEIIILKLIGATHGFIRRPLLYRGLMYGFFGGCFAALLVGTMLWWLESPTKNLAQTYNSIFVLNGLSWKAGFYILLNSSLLGLLGSWVAVQKHLIATECIKQ